MNIEFLQNICNQFTGVTQDIKWEDELCFNVCGKMFFIVSLDHVPTIASFKASEEDFLQLSHREGFIPAPYLARYKWIQIDDINRLNANQWNKYIEQSYQLVFSKLSRKVRNKLT